MLEKVGEFGDRHSDELTRKGKGTGKFVATTAGSVVLGEVIRGAIHGGYHNSGEAGGRSS